MKIHAWAAAIGLASTGCLGPLVDNQPTASANLLPHDAQVPTVASNNDLLSQLKANDGLPDAPTPIVVPLLTGGVSNGKQVSYWNFGAMTTAPSPIYMLVDANGGFVDHPPFVDALPGDPAYSAIHTVFYAQVTDKYKGELITTSAALADAVELGLILPPVSQGRHIASPIVLPDTTIEVTSGASPTTKPTTVVYGHGVAAGIFQFGGKAGIQPGAAIQGTARVSFLREEGGTTGNGVYDQGRPIFQALVPPEAGTDNLPPGPSPDYLPLALEIDVDLVHGTTPDTIMKDGDLFTTPDKLPPFTPPSTIGTVSDQVATFNVTQNVLFLQQQFVAGQL